MARVIKVLTPPKEHVALSGNLGASKPIPQIKKRPQDWGISFSFHLLSVEGTEFENSQA
jgi:hypothetical protein